MERLIEKRYEVSNKSGFSKQYDLWLQHQFFSQSLFFFFNTQSAFIYAFYMGRRLLTFLRSQTLWLFRVTTWNKWSNPPKALVSFLFFIWLLAFQKVAMVAIPKGYAYMLALVCLVWVSWEIILLLSDISEQKMEAKHALLCAWRWTQ